VSTPFPAAPRASWLQRHWRWAVPLLCLFCLTVFAGVVLLFVSALFGMMRSSDVYTTAMQRMRESPQVVEALGTPIEPGWYLSGQINISGASGEASLQIPISGPKAEADLYVEAEKTSGRWTYSTLIVNVDGQDKQIDLLSERVDTKTSK
jgi:hypothetical protein